MCLCIFASSNSYFFFFGKLFFLWYLFLFIANDCWKKSEKSQLTARKRKNSGSIVQHTFFMIILCVPHSQQLLVRSKLGDLSKNYCFVKRFSYSSYSCCYYFFHIDTKHFCKYMYIIERLLHSLARWREKSPWGLELVCWFFYYYFFNTLFSTPLWPTQSFSRTHSLAAAELEWVSRFSLVHSSRK